MTLGVVNARKQAFVAWFFALRARFGGVGEGGRVLGGLAWSITRGWVGHSAAGRVFNAGVDPGLVLGIEEEERVVMVKSGRARYDG